MLPYHTFKVPLPFLLFGIQRSSDSGDGLSPLHFQLVMREDIAKHTIPHTSQTRHVLNYAAPNAWQQSLSRPSRWLKQFFSQIFLILLSLSGVAQFWIPQPPAPGLSFNLFILFAPSQLGRDNGEQAFHSKSCQPDYSHSVTGGDRLPLTLRLFCIPNPVGPSPHSKFPLLLQRGSFLLVSNLTMPLLQDSNAKQSKLSL